MHHHDGRRIIAITPEGVEFLELWARFENIETGETQDISLSWPKRYLKQRISLESAKERRFGNFFMLWDYFKNSIQIPPSADCFVFFIRRVSENTQRFTTCYEVKDSVEVSPRFWVNAQFTGSGGVISRFGKTYYVNTSASFNIVLMRPDC